MTTATLEDILKFCNSTRRPFAFAEWAEALPRSKAAGIEFWNAIEREWPGFDAIPHRLFQRLFFRFEKFRPASMVPDIDGHIKIYRGQDAGAEYGLSWTTDFDVAAGFARGHRGIMNNDPNVIEIQVSAKAVAMLISDRDESEVVLFSLPVYELRNPIRHKIR